MLTRAAPLPAVTLAPEDAEEEEEEDELLVSSSSNWPSATPLKGALPTALLLESPVMKASRVLTLLTHREEGDAEAEPEDAAPKGVSMRLPRLT